MKHGASLKSYEAARTGAALVDRSERGWVVVSGKDRLSYLHGLLTNDVASLEAGRGCYTAYLTPQGRMIAELWVYELGDVVLLSMPHDVTTTVLTNLDRFVFTEDVQLGDVSSTFAALAVIGPAAEAVASAALGLPLGTLPHLDHGNHRTSFRGHPAIAVRTIDLGEPGFDLLVEAAAAGELRRALSEGGAVELDHDTAEALRIEGGIPRFHQDMDEETIPLEAGIEPSAISFTKGCYVGQEVIIRILHRGHGRVARKLAGLVLTGDVEPNRGAVVQSADRSVGEVTSGTWSPTLARPIALAYLHRDFLVPGTLLTVDGVGAEVVALPFVHK